MSGKVQLVKFVKLQTDVCGINSHGTKVHLAPIYKIGEIGWLTESHGGVHDIQTLNASRYFNVPDDCIEKLLDDPLETVEAHKAWEQFQAKIGAKPYIQLDVEILTDPPRIGVWLVNSGNKHRLIGGEDEKNPAKIADYWMTVAVKMGVYLEITPFVQMAIIDANENDEKYTKTNRYSGKLWIQRKDKK